MYCLAMPMTPPLVDGAGSEVVSAGAGAVRSCERLAASS